MCGKFNIFFDQCGKFNILNLSIGKKWFFGQRGKSGKFNLLNLSVLYFESVIEWIVFIHSDPIAFDTIA